MRLGILAASRIAEAAVIEPVVDGVELIAVAARDEQRASQVAVRWNIPLAYGSYEAMLDSGEIEAVYIGTPASLHRPWVEAAVRNGLHVLCEKPFASNAADARRAAEAARSSNRVVMEAFHWRYHPLVGQMRATLDRLGSIRTVEAWFDVQEGRIGRGDIRWNFQLGGGATMDLGCYCIAWVRWAVGAEPTVTTARAETTADGVDAWLEAELEWSGGVRGWIRSSMVAPVRGSGLVVSCEEGTMRVDNPLAPQHGSRITVETTDGITEFEVDRSSTYTHQLVAFRDAVVHGAPFPTTVDEAIANMEVVDACYRAAGLQVRPAVE